MSGRLPVRRTQYVRGLWLLARGRREAFTMLGADTRAYLNSLAPLVAFSLVIGALEALSGSVVRGAALFLSSLCGLLAPPVIAEPFCRRWGCMPRWALFANVLNWLTILMVPVLFVAVFAAVLLVSAGVPLLAATLFMTCFVLTYVTWLQWFSARGGLGITRWQAVILLFAIQVGTGLLTVIQVETGSGSFVPPGIAQQLKTPDK